MSKRILPVIAGVSLAASLSFGCSSESEPTEVTPVVTPIDVEVSPYGLNCDEVEKPPYGPEEEIAARTRIAANWICDAAMVADKADHKAAAQIVTFLSKSAVSKLISEHAFMSKGGTEPSVYVTPLISAQEKSFAGQFFGIGDFSDFHAIYSPSQDVIGLREDVKVSDTFKGMLLLHEGKHALDYERLKYDITDNDVLVEHEVKTHTFENELLKSIGGKPYLEFIDEWADAVNKNYEKTSAFDIFSGNDEERLDILADIFGPSLSPEEDELRLTATAIDAGFRAIDKAYGDSDSTEAKEAFYKQLAGGFFG